MRSDIDFNDLTTVISQHAHCSKVFSLSHSRQAHVVIKIGVSKDTNCSLMNYFLPDIAT